MEKKTSTCATIVIAGDAYENMKKYQDEYREKTTAYLSQERAVNMMLKEHEDFKKELGRLFFKRSVPPLA